MRVLILIVSIVVMTIAVRADAQEVGNDIAYSAACATEAQIREVIAKGGGMVKGCYGTRRPWPARLMERLPDTLLFRGMPVRIWRAKDLPPPHDEVWLFFRVPIQKPASTAGFRQARWI